MMLEATSDDLQLSIENMKKYISGPTTLKTMLTMLQDELEKVPEPYTQKPWRKEFVSRNTSPSSTRTQ